MVKRVFSIIGIVLGVVTAFFGVVIGVLGARGMLKRPVIYPTSLVFLDSDSVVIERNAFNPEKSWEEQMEGEDKPTIYSLMLQGINSSTKRAVNKQSCFLWFENNVGADLITLCYENGQPLEKDEHNYYRVKCNLPIYYMINEVDHNVIQDGKVMLKARSVNERCETLDPFVLWIDREVERITIKDGSKQPVGFNQEIEAGVGIPLEFKYNVETEYSLKPISKESAKEIELFYLAKGYSTDYVRVTPEEIANPASPLSEFFVFDEESKTFIFEAKKAGTYTFYLGAFKTYESKVRYEEAIADQTIINPNYHQVTYKFGEEPAMTVTTVTIGVQNIEIGEVSMGGTGVVLNLYSKKDYISLSGVSNVPDAKDSNLGLMMKKTVGNETVVDSSRFAEAKFGYVEFADKTDLKEFPIFQANVNDKIVYAEIKEQEGQEVYEDVYSGDTLCKPELSNKQIIDEDLNVYTIVEYVYTGDEGGEGEEITKFYCSNGMAVYSDDKGYKLIRTGTYLNYYIKSVKDNNESFVQVGSDVFDFEVEKLADSNSWNMISKNKPVLKSEDGEELVLGVLVVNSFGESRTEKLFASIPVTVEPMPFAYDVKQEEVTLNVSFESDSINCEGIAFEDLIEITGGTYNASLLFVETTDKPNIVSTIDEIRFQKDGKTYVLVGCVDEKVDEETGKTVKTFVNKVEIKDKLTKDNKSCKLTLVQLKNAYDQTVNDIITNSVLNGVVAEPLNSDQLCVMVGSDPLCEIVNFYEDELTINGQYIVNEDLISCQFVNSVEVEGTPKYAFYENSTDNYMLIINSTNESMMGKINLFFDLTKDSISCNYPNNLAEVYVGFVDKTEDRREAIAIVFKTGACLSDDTIPISWSLNLSNDQKIDLPDFRILNSSPEQIVYRYDKNGVVKEDAYIKLSKTTTEAENSSTRIEVVYFYNTNQEFSISIYISGMNNDGEFVEKAGAYRFNNETSQGNIMGFQDEVWKNQTYSVEYEILDSSIAEIVGENKNIICKKVGKTYLAITIGETTQYIKFILTSKGTLIAPKNITKKLTDGDQKDGTYNTYLISDINGDRDLDVKYYDNGKLIENPYTASHSISIANVKSVYYGDGVLSVEGSEYEWELINRKINEDGTPVEEKVLIIEMSTNGWVFRKSNKNVSLTISFDLETLNETHSMTMIFTSDTTVSINSEWLDKTLYSGTKVLLQPGANQNAIPIFNSSSVTFEAKIGDQDITNEDDSGNTLLDLTNVNPTDNLIITAKLNGKTIHPFTGFKVKPNVIATPTTETFEATTGEDYDLAAIYDLEAYKLKDASGKDIIYGSSEDALYSNENLENLSSYTNLSIDIVSNESSPNSDPELTWSEDKLNSEYKLNVGSMSVINGEVERTIELKWKDTDNNYTTVSRLTIKVKNSITATVLENPEIKALKENSLNDLISGSITNLPDGYKLSSVEENSPSNKLTFTLTNAGKFITNTIISEERKISLKLTFNKAEGESQALTLDIENVTIRPFSPDANQNLTVYSGEDFDVCAAVYEDAKFNGEVLGNEYSISFVGIADADGTILSGIYTKTEDDNVITISNIDKDKKVVRLVYTFNYAGGSYNYYEDLTIKNPQTIDLQYPESGLKIDNSDTNIRFLKGYEQDAREIAGTDENYNGTYIIKKNTIKNYEPLLITDSNTLELNFIYDDIKKMSRVNIQKESDFNLDIYNDKYNDDVSIELIGHGTLAGTTDFAQKIITNNPNAKNSITLPKSSYSLNDMLVFKLSTSSGNSKYYFAHIYREQNLNLENNMKVVLRNSGSNIFSRYEEDNNSVSHIEYSSGMTYSGLLETLEKYKENFNIEYGSTTTKPYLYNGVNTGGADFDYGTHEVGEVQKSNQFSDVSGVEIKLTEHFSTITIGLLYQNKTKIYTYGTITIFTQPEDGFIVNDYEVIHKNDVSKDDDERVANLVYDLPNGEFTADIPASAEEHSYPIDSTATITSVSGGYKVFNYNTIINFPGDIDKALGNVKVDGNYNGYEYKSVLVDNTKYVFNSDYQEDRQRGETDGDYIARLQSDAYFYVEYEDKVGDEDEDEDEDEKVKSVHGQILTADNDNNKFVIEKRIPEDLTFNVKHKYGNTIFYVDYTYKATALTKQSTINNNPITVGKFKDGKFNDSVKINDGIKVNKTDLTYSEFFKGSYAGDVKFTVSYKGQSYDGTTFSSVNDFVCYDNSDPRKMILSFDTSSQTFTFVQGREARNVEISFEYESFNTGDKIRKFKFIVEAGIHFGVTEGEGLSSASPEGSNPTGDYEKNIGSKIGITYTNDSYKHTYTIGGLTINTNVKATLELTFGDRYNYIIDSDNKVLTLKTTPITIDDDDSINFVHTITPKNVTIKIVVKADGETYESSREFYAQICSTYEGLKAKYLTDGANHENVTSTTKFNDLHGDVLNGNRVVLLVKNGDVIEEKSGVKYVNGGMGFDDPNNPNFIEFSILDKYGTIETTLDEDDDTFISQTLTFNKQGTGSNTDAQLTLKNLTASDDSSQDSLQVLTYNFQIMQGDKLDGLIYENVKNNNLKLEYQVAGRKSGNNLAFTTQKTEDDKNNKSKLYIVGKLLDTKNTNIELNEDGEIKVPFKLDVDRAAEVISRVLYGGVPLNNTATAEFKNFEYVNDKDQTQKLYTNAIQYQFKVVGIDLDFTLTIDFDSYIIYLHIDSDTAITDVKQFKVSLTGANGGRSVDDSVYIFEKLNIVLSGVDFESKAEKIADTTVYGGDQIQITDILKGTTDTSGYKIKLIEDDITKSYFEFGKITKNITDICYMSNDGYLNILSPGETIYGVQATFKVLLDEEDVVAADADDVAKEEIIVDEFVYRFDVNLNMQFVVNGAKLEDSKGANEVTTNFHLNRKQAIGEDGKIIAKDGDEDGVIDNLDEVKFPMTIGLTNNEAMPAGSQKDQQNGEKCYDVLHYSLYNLTRGTPYGSNLITIEKPEDRDPNGNEYSVIDAAGNRVLEDVIKIDTSAKKITFEKDFNGVITLYLVNNTGDLGKYSVKWIINVTGIRNPVLQVNSYARVDANGTPFPSTTPINAINDTTDKDGVIVHWKNDNKFDNDSIGVEYEYSYKMYSYDYVASLNNVSNETLFNNTDSIHEDYEYTEGKIPTAYRTMEALSGKIELPAVPLTMGKVSYVVVYKMTVKYLYVESATNSTNSTDYYFAYTVINEGKISPYEVIIDENNKTRSEVVNVDNGVTQKPKQVSQTIDNYYLELFYFKQTAKDGGTTYTLTCEIVDGKSEPVIVLTVGTDVVTEVYYEHKDRKFYKRDTDPTTETNLIYEIKVDGETTTLHEKGSDVKLATFTTKTETYQDATKQINSVFKSEFNDIFAFKAFIQSFYGKEYDSTSVSNNTGIVLGEKPVMLTYIEAGRYGVNLSDYFNETEGKFSNEFIEDFRLMQDGVEIYTVYKFDKSKDEGFKLTTSSKIESKGGYKLSEIFDVSSYYGGDFNKFQDYLIIGVGTPEGNWFNNVSNDGIIISGDELKKYNVGATDPSKITTIKIPGKISSTGGDISYEVKLGLAKGSGTGSGDLYVLEQPFYYISEEVIVPAYSNVSNETTRFVQNYTIAKWGDKDVVSMTLTSNTVFDAFVEWSMSGGVLTKPQAKDVVKINKIEKSGGDALLTEYNEEDFFMEETVERNEDGEITAKYYTKLMISCEVLKKYKQENPTKSTYKPTIYDSTTSTYVSTTLLFTIGDKVFKCEVVFMLDDFVQVDLPYTPQGETSTDIKECIFEADPGDSQKFISKFKIPIGNKYDFATDKNQISKFVIPTQEGVEADAYNKYVRNSIYLKPISGNYELDVEKLNAYFGQDGKQESLSILIKLITNDGSTMIFKLVITENS